MTAVQTLQLLAAALLILSGIAQLIRAAQAEDPLVRDNRIEDPLRRQHARLSGWLFLFAGALFLVLALGFRE